LPLPPTHTAAALLTAAHTLAFAKYIFLFRVVCARINRPVIPPAYLHCPHWCNTTARLLGNIRPPPTSLVHAIHHPILAMTISCKGQLTPARRYRNNNKKSRARTLTTSCCCVGEKRARKSGSRLPERRRAREGYPPKKGVGPVDSLFCVFYRWKKSSKKRIQTPGEVNPNRYICTYIGLVPTAAHNRTETPLQ